MSMPDPSPDAFMVVANLLAVIADPKLAAKRMSDLERQIEAVVKAREQLAADRQQHATTVAAAKADLDTRGATLLKRETAVGIAERVKRVPLAFF